MSLTSIVNGKVLTPDGVIENGVVNIEGGTIIDVGDASEVSPPRDSLVFDASKNWVAPGFVDIHVHGAVGHDTMDRSYEALDKISRFYAQHGTTNLLMTTISSPLEDIGEAVEAVGEAMEKGTSGASFIGAHVEGPYYIYEQRGCHAPEYLRKPDPDEYKPLIKSGKGVIKMMSFSPELPGALELTRILKDHSIVASMGHSNATYERIVECVEAGVNHCLHIYCVLGEIHKCRPEERPNTEIIPGTLGAVLDLDKLTAEVICDGVHVHPALVRILLRCKGLDRTVLVTDAMHGAGMGDGEYVFGGLKVRVEEGVARTTDGILASSTKPMEYMLNRFYQFTGLPIQDGLKAATINPARVIGIDNLKGSIEKGKDADLTILADDFSIKGTYVKGVKVY